MIKDFKVKPGPAFYCYGEGALDKLPELLAEHNAKRVLVVHGTVSWQKAVPFLTKLRSAVDYTITYEEYHGECSYAEGKRLAEIVKINDIDFIVGVGGGKLCDLVLYTASIAFVPFGVVPTLASNCAPWTPLSVMYKENGLAEGKSEHTNLEASFLVTDPRLVIDSPVNYFVAGIADTLAKWYEAELILQQDAYVNEPMLQMAGFAAKMCRDKILQESEQAIADMKAGRLSDEFVHISEVIIAIAGTVGGFGDKYARNTAAHALHDAISAYLPEVHRYLHGEKVAYGIFFQLALEKKWQVIDELMPFYKKLGLPMSLTEMGVYPMAEETLDSIIKLANGKAKVHLLPIDVNEPILKEALTALEGYMQKKMNKGVSSALV